MFKSGIPGILRDDVSEDGGSRTGDSLSGVPVPVYNGTSGPGALCDDLPDRNHEGHDHDHQQSCDPSGDGKLQSISELASYVVCGGRFPVPVRYDASHGGGYELEDDPAPPCSPHGSHRSFLRHNGLQKDRKRGKKGSRRGAQSGSSAKRKVLVLKKRGIPSGSRHAVLLYGPRKLCKRMVCYLFKEHRLYVCKPCDRDGIRDLDHDHDRKDRHCERLKEGAAGKDPGGDLHTAVRVSVDPRLRE